MDETTAIYKAQQGDLAAFNQLVMAYQGTAYNVAYRVMGNSETAADACQDAFLKAYKSIKQYEGGSFKSWLFRIVTNTCYDHLRYKKRRPATSLEDMTDNPDEHNTHLVSDIEAPEDRVLRGELNDLIQLGINQLPEDQRLVLVLSDVQGMAYQEIAEIIDQPLGTVKSRLSRGRRRLRDFLLEQKELLPGQYRLNS
ncbi:MAG TPA: sigma-70 family RNA polymerase sigma factor [Anaerolineae bacterium]|nr:sigma-70 family RNA polymerase sigma factor [Anaerolineae bacterium]MCB0179391.1 sigma-70 family RNA polymerase sigma factor [Anaerolineae bacterium]MCB9106768.1 sigma-70 family RNA polymerase sigma factor [Anaerolineales bacterium]HRV90784.1 sigma-70 family RNA polymerase sigma factor [Anaerolineae bacterium]